MKLICGRNLGLIRYSTFCNYLTAERVYFPEVKGILALRKECHRAPTGVNFYGILIAAVSMLNLDLPTTLARLRTSDVLDEPPPLSPMTGRRKASKWTASLRRFHVAEVLGHLEEV